MITRGKDGSILFHNDKFLSCPAFATDVVDRIGAGDTLLSMSSLCLSSEVPNDISLLLGNLAAAETVSKTGTGHVLDKNNILKALKSLMG